MLDSLSIRNVVLIEKLDLDLKKGLNVFTGETGTGKSVVLDALSLAIGARGDTGLIRHGTDMLSVVASFDIPQNHPVIDFLKNQDLDLEENHLILKRTLGRDGKSKAFINGQPVPIRLLKEVGDFLVEIHGQFSSHRLLNPAVHLEVLDRYGQLSKELKQLQNAYHLWQEKKLQFQEIQKNLEKVQADEIFLRQIVQELTDLKPQTGEEEKLTEQRKILMNSEKIVAYLHTAVEILGTEERGGIPLICRALNQIEHANELGNGRFDEIKILLEESVEKLNDAFATIERECGDFQDSDALTEIDNRLFKLKDLARKNQTTIEQLPTVLKQAEEKLKNLSDSSDILEKITKEEKDLRMDFFQKAEALHQQRQKIAEKLDLELAQEFPALKLGTAQFKTEISQLDQTQANPNGITNVLFTVSTNKGTPFAGIHKIASGGELARFMLGLKVHLAKTEQIPVLIFDEVDTGISGATADAVGKRLYLLSKEHQVLVITHSAQVASFGLYHWRVEKLEKNNQILTTVSLLEPQERLIEIARMLSGEKITEQARLAAQSMIEGKQNG